MSVWRQGKEKPQLVYKGNRCMAACPSPELAAEIVERMNAAPESGTESPRKGSWARLRKHGPALIFDWHDTEAEARAACTKAFHVVAFFPDEVPAGGEQRKG